MNKKNIARLSGIILLFVLGYFILYFNFLKPRWNYIIIHHSSTKLGSVKIFRNGHEERGGAWPLNDPLFYHIVIGNGKGAGNGEIQMGKRWTRQQLGGGCSTLKGLDSVEKAADYLKAFSDYYNYTGIHICLVGDFSHKEPTTRQLASLSSVVNRLCDEYDIPWHSVIGHCKAQLAPTDCPGKNFPMHRFRKQLIRAKKANLHLDDPHIFTWTVRLINFWPVLGIFAGEFYYSLWLILLNLCFAFLIWRVAWPLAGFTFKIQKDIKIQPYSESREKDYLEQRCNKTEDHDQDIIPEHSAPMQSTEDPDE